MAHRLEVIKGDSTKTVLRWKKANMATRCDIISVDGGHSYGIALADLTNMQLLANPRFHVLFLDDTNCNKPWCTQVVNAMIEMQKRGAVVKLDGFQDQEDWPGSKGSHAYGGGGLPMLQYLLRVPGTGGGI